MTKRTVQQIKDDQGFRKDSPCCGNCKHYTSTFKTKTPGEWIKETNKRCTIGNFATGKSCWCVKHEFRKSDNEIK